MAPPTDTTTVIMWPTGAPEHVRPVYLAGTKQHVGLAIKAWTQDAEDSALEGAGYIKRAGYWRGGDAADLQQRLTAFGLTGLKYNLLWLAK